MALEPCPVSDQPFPLVPIYVASLVVASAFLVMGALVWLLRRGRGEAWAFGLFSAFVSVQLFTAFDTYRQTLGYERSAINFFLLAAAVFHLFTTYPFEPRWLAPRRWLRAALYGVALVAAPIVCSGRALRHSLLRDRAARFRILDDGQRLFARHGGAGAPSATGRGGRRTRRRDVARRPRFVLPGARLDRRRNLPANRHPRLPGAALVHRVPGVGGLRHREEGTLRHPPPGAFLGRIRCFDARDHRVLRPARRHGGRRRREAPLERTLPGLHVGVPLLRDSRGESVARAVADPRRSSLRPRARPLSPDGARDLRGDGLDALDPGDRRADRARALGCDGRRTLDGVADLRRRARVPSRGEWWRVASGRGGGSTRHGSSRLQVPLDATPGSRPQRPRRRSRREHAQGL